MSDVIKLNLKGKKIRKVMTNEPETENAIVEINDEATIEKKLQNEYQRGFAEGYSKGSEETEKKYENLLYEKNEEFYSILKEFEEKIKEYEKSFAEIVIKLAEIIASKILKREIEQKNIIDKTLNEALTQVIAANNIVIKINPEDIKLLEKDGQINKAMKFSKITFEADDTIDKGGCIVETEIGNVDARIDAQLSEIIKALEINFLNDNEDDTN